MMSMYLAKSNGYESATMTSNGAVLPFTSPARLALWASNDVCNPVLDELVATSEAIDHADWRKYSFYFQPKVTGNYFILEARHLEGKDRARGNILVDNLSPIVQVGCKTLKPIVDCKKIDYIQNPDYESIKKHLQTFDYAQLFSKNQHNKWMHLNKELVFINEKPELVNPFLEILTEAISKAKKYKVSFYYRNMTCKCTSLITQYFTERKNVNHRYYEFSKNKIERNIVFKDKNIIISLEEL